MAGSEHGAAPAEQAHINEEQPIILKELLKTINAARRQSSLYGSDHQSTAKVVDVLCKVIDDFMENMGQVTLIFAKDALISNDHYYSPTPDSHDLYQRLRARGTIAITFVDRPSADQVAEFLAFLNAEPREIREQGGPSAYLRNRKVTRIVATTAVYTSGEDTDAPPHAGGGDSSPPADLAIGAAINWLTRQEDMTDSEQIPITDILSSPDMAGKLIQEAVTKLHSSRKSGNSGELTTEIVNDLKDLASTDPEGWDRATPQIRKAMSKLPSEMRSGMSVFSSDRAVEAGERPAGCADVSNVEEIVSTELQLLDEGEAKSLDSHVVADLLGKKPVGLLSGWRRELRPENIVMGYGRTLDMLMSWETKAPEHGRLAHALAGLIPWAVESKNTDTALSFAGHLANETRRTNDEPWRSSNAKSALQKLELPVLQTLVEQALKSPNRDHHVIAAALVEAVPALAVGVSGLLDVCEEQVFVDSLKRGISQAGRSGAAALGAMLRNENSEQREWALETLVAMKSEWAVREIGAAVRDADVMFIIKALSMLAAVPLRATTLVCMSFLTHKSPDVRYTALQVLGDLGDEIAVPELVRFARQSGIRRRDLEQQLSAIESLSRIANADVVPVLEEIASRRPLFFRGRHEAVREAVRKAVDRIMGWQKTEENRAA